MQQWTEMLNEHTASQGKGGVEMEDQKQGEEKKDPSESKEDPRVVALQETVRKQQMKLDDLNNKYQRLVELGNRDAAERKEHNEAPAADRVAELEQQLKDAQATIVELQRRDDDAVVTARTQRRAEQLEARERVEQRVKALLIDRPTDLRAILDDLAVLDPAQSSSSRAGSSPTPPPPSSDSPSSSSSSSLSSSSASSIPTDDDVNMAEHKEDNGERTPLHPHRRGDVLEKDKQQFVVLAVLQSSADGTEYTIVNASNKKKRGDPFTLDSRNTRFKRLRVTPARQRISLEALQTHGETEKEHH